MAAKMLMLVGDTDGVYRDLIERVIACWPADGRPDVKTLSIDESLNDLSWLDRARVVWVLTEHDGARKNRLFELLAVVEEHRHPSVITRDDESDALGGAFSNGAVFAPASATPVAICAVLRTLWNQHETIRALMLEIEILNAHNGGLATQFDKLDEELRLAAQLQREFLPQDLPTMPGIDFRVFFRPASYVSGDIYDAIRLDDKHMGFFVADAVGHGVPAALLTVYIKRSLRTVHRQSSTTGTNSLIMPDESLQYLNRDMVRQQSGNIRFATAVYGIIDCETLELTFARAGHPYPLLIHKDGSSDWLKAEGGLLGIFPDEEYEINTVQLSPGDRLVLYSDGFELAFPPDKNDANQSKRVANDTYIKELEDLGNGSLDAAFERFATKLDQQSGSLNQLDDLTAMLIEVS